MLYVDPCCKASTLPLEVACVLCACPCGPLCKPIILRAILLSAFEVHLYASSAAIISCSNMQYSFSSPGCCRELAVVLSFCPSLCSHCSHNVCLLLATTPACCPFLWYHLRDGTCALAIICAAVPVCSSQPCLVVCQQGHLCLGLQPLPPGPHNKYLHLPPPPPPLLSLLSFAMACPGPTPVL